MTWQLWKLLHSFWFGTALRYLGVPVSVSRLIANWLPLDEKMLKRLDGCQGSSLSIGARTTLLDSSLSNMPTSCYVYVPPSPNYY